MIATNAYTGIYDPPTAARYLLAGRMGHETYRVDSRTLIRWARIGVASPDLIHARGWDMILTFEDLISLRVVAALRAAGVQWKDIRYAEATLRDLTGYSRPFAREELWTFQSEVFAKFQGMLIAASRHGQLAMEILSEFLLPVAGLSFIKQVADSWEPRPLIVLAPDVQFGEPCIKGTRIPVSAIASLKRGGDSPDLIMRAYSITEVEFEAAINWAESVAA